MATAPAPSDSTPTPTPTLDTFADTLSQESDWYSLGVFLGASYQELNQISLDRRDEDTLRGCLSDLYQCLCKKDKPLTWVAIETSLKRLNNFSLANVIHTKYTITKSPLVKPRPYYSNNPLDEPLDTVMEVAYEYQELIDGFDVLKSKIKQTIKEATYMDLGEVQDLVRRQCGLPNLPRSVATVDVVFTRIEEQCSIVNFHVLSFLVEHLLENVDHIKRDIVEFKKGVEHFKASTNMLDLVALTKQKEIEAHAEQKLVKLKVREFWCNFTMKQFEILINDVFQTLYDILTHVHITKGCICISWLMPSHVDASELLPQLPLEFIRLIGVIYLHIGNEVIYNIEGDGCDSIEAAMIQAIELKNTRAIELLLAVGCSPQVAIYNDSNTNTQVEAIIDRSGESECNSCTVKEKITIEHHYQENDVQQQRNLAVEEELPQEINEVNEPVMIEKAHLKALKDESLEDNEMMLEKLEIESVEDTFLKRTNRLIEIT